MSVINDGMECNFVTIWPTISQLRTYNEILLRLLATEERDVEAALINVYVWSVTGMNWRTIMTSMPRVCLILEIVVSRLCTGRSTQDGDMSRSESEAHRNEQTSDVTQHEPTLKKPNNRTIQ